MCSRGRFGLDDCKDMDGNSLRRVEEVCRLSPKFKGRYVYFVIVYVKDAEQIYEIMHSSAKLQFPPLSVLPFVRVIRFITN